MNIEIERQAFEHEVKTQHANPDLTRKPDGSYKNYYLECAWMGWQQRAALANRSAQTEQQPVAWIVPDFGFLFPTQEAASRYLKNIEDPREPRAVYAATVAQTPADGLVEALEHARHFIRNGVALGYIKMPDAGTPDPAHDTLPKIEAALAAHRAGGAK